LIDNGPPREVGPEYRRGGRRWFASGRKGLYHPKLIHPPTDERSERMKAVYVAMMAAAGIVMAGQAHADEALAKAKNCMACHQIDKKLVGPAYKDVAAKYKGDKNAVAMLAAKIKAGGKGVWGEVPMPPNNVTPEEATKLATWVLAQK
jgi:cytochrome c